MTDSGGRMRRSESRIAFRLGGALLLPLALAGCECPTEIKWEVPSPDGVHRAVLFERNCGATSRNNLQIAIVRGPHLPDQQGNVIVLTDTSARGALIEDVVQMTWESPTILQVAYDPMLEVIHRDTIVEGIAIRFTQVDGVGRGDRPTAQACVRLDSTSIVLAAVRTLGDPRPAREWRVSSFSRTDSGTSVTVLPARPANPRTVISGGGGIVFVPADARACVVERFR